MALVLPTHPSLQSPCKNYSDSLTYKSVMASFKKFQELSFIFRIKADIHKMLKKKKKTYLGLTMFNHLNHLGLIY